MCVLIDTTQVIQYGKQNFYHVVIFTSFVNKRYRVLLSEKP